MWGDSGPICLKMNMLGRNSASEFCRARSDGTSSTYNGSLLFACIGPKSSGGKCIAVHAIWPSMADCELDELCVRLESLTHRHWDGAFLLKSFARWM